MPSLRVGSPSEEERRQLWTWWMVAFASVWVTWDLNIKREEMRHEMVCHIYIQSNAVCYDIGFFNPKKVLARILYKQTHAGCTSIQCLFKSPGPVKQLSLYTVVPYSSVIHLRITLNRVESFPASYFSSSIHMHTSCLLMCAPSFLFITPPLKPTHFLNE